MDPDESSPDSLPGHTPVQAKQRVGPRPLREARGWDLSRVTRKAVGGLDQLINGECHGAVCAVDIMAPT